MNWDAIGAVGEIVGALGVIASLVYLGFQIRLNSRQIRLNADQVEASIYQSTNDAFVDWIDNEAHRIITPDFMHVVRDLADPERTD